MKPIDGDALAERVMYKFIYDPDYTLEDAIYDIQDAEELEEVVEVVRCKDCKYGHRLTDANGYNYRTCNYPWGHGMMVEEYGFCKWGKRRTEDAEVH